MRRNSLSNNKLGKISDITSDIGQAVFGITILPFVFGVDTAKPLVILSGLIISIVCWALSIYLKK
jgi:hypothetical protein